MKCFKCHRSITEVSLHRTEELGITNKNWACLKCCPKEIPEETKMLIDIIQGK